MGEMMKLNNQYEEIEFRFRIDDLRWANKRNLIRNGSNLSQAKKLISKQTYIPVSELQLISVIQGQLKDNDDEDNVIYDDKYIIQQKDVLYLGIKSIRQDQVKVEFAQGSRPKSLPICIYKDDIFRNIRAKLWLEMHAEYIDPTRISMLFGGENTIPIKENDLDLTVQEFIQQNNLKEFKNTYNLQFEEESEGKIDLILHDMIFDKQFISIRFKQELQTVQDVQYLIQLYEEQVKQTTKYNKLKENYPSLQDKDNFLYQLYDHGSLFVFLQINDNRINLKEFENKQQNLPNGIKIEFFLSGEGK